MKQIKEILTVDEHEVELGERSVEIDTVTQAPEMREIVTAIKDTMNAKDLVALSAPMIGYKRRIFCIRFKEEIKTFINPVIYEAKGLELSRETSLTIPGQEFIRPRNNDITVMYQRPLGQPETRQLIGLAAIIFQQMEDTLDGVFLSDIGMPVLEGFDEATEEEKNEIIGMYLDSLDLKRNDLEKEIQETPELKQLDDGIKYLESVMKGETKLYAEEEKDGELKNVRDEINNKVKGKKKLN